MKRDKTKIALNNNALNADLETENYEENISKAKQPILPFSNKEKVKNVTNTFKLPTINFLEKNPGLKNSKNGDNIELNKNSEFLEKILLDFGVEGEIKKLVAAPL